jgi:hypothetical protein
MIQIFRWSPAIAALCFTIGCSDSQSSLGPLASPGHSAEVTGEACESELNALRSAIGAAEFTGKNRETDRANLLLKVDAAQAKLVEGKFADALQKLGDVRSTVSALSTPDAKGKTKLDTAGAAAIDAALTDVESCVRSLTL